MILFSKSFIPNISYDLFLAIRIRHTFYNCRLLDTLYLILETHDLQLTTYNLQPNKRVHSHRR